MFYTTKFFLIFQAISLIVSFALKNQNLHGLPVTLWRLIFTFTVFTFLFSVQNDKQFHGKDNFSISIRAEYMLWLYVFQTPNIFFFFVSFIFVNICTQRYLHFVWNYSCFLVNLEKDWILVIFWYIAFFCMDYLIWSSFANQQYRFVIQMLLQYLFHPYWRW